MWILTLWSSCCHISPLFSFSPLYLIKQHVNILLLLKISSKILGTIAWGSWYLWVVKRCFLTSSTPFTFTVSPLPFVVSKQVPFLPAHVKIIYYLLLILAHKFLFSVIYYSLLQQIHFVLKSSHIRLWWPPQAGSYVLWPFYCAPITSQPTRCSKTL